MAADFLNANEGYGRRRPMDIRDWDCIYMHKIPPRLVDKIIPKSVDESSLIGIGGQQGTLALPIPLSHLCTCTPLWMIINSQMGCYPLWMRTRIFLWTGFICWSKELFVHGSSSWGSNMISFPSAIHNPKHAEPMKPEGSLSLASVEVEAPDWSEDTRGKWTACWKILSYSCMHVNARTHVQRI